MVENWRTYSAYGMKIQSSVELPDLLSSRGRADTFMRLGNVTDDLIKNAIGNSDIYDRPGVKIRASKKAMCFDWDRLGTVLVREGRDVLIQPEEETIEEDLNPFLTGPVLAVLLHQRGYLVLHASAVEIEGLTVAFLGAKGYGKSTLAAYMRSRGHRLISDDIVPVSFGRNEVLTVPGFPRIKLYDDSIKAVGSNPEEFPTIHRFVEKRSFQCPENFSTKPVRLDALYILNEGENIEIEELNAVSAFIEVTKNTHLNRYLQALQCQPKHFAECQKLLQTIPVFKLNRPHDFNGIGEIAEKLEEHAAQLKDKRKFCQAV